MDITFTLSWACCSVRCTVCALSRVLSRMNQPCILTYDVTCPFSFLLDPLQRSKVEMKGIPVKEAMMAVHSVKRLNMCKVCKLGVGR